MALAGAGAGVSLSCHDTMKPLFALAAAALAALISPGPPFPAPKLIGITPDIRCDWGPVTELKAAEKMLIVRTEAGPFELMIGPGAKFAGADGKPLPSVASIQPGQKVRAYYVVNKGAKAQEIDVIP
jgi:hypothetical protein